MVSTAKKQRHYVCMVSVCVCVWASHPVYVHRYDLEQLLQKNLHNYSENSQMEKMSCKHLTRKECSLGLKLTPTQPRSIWCKHSLVCTCTHTHTQTHTHHKLAAGCPRSSRKDEEAKGKEFSVSEFHPFWFKADNWIKIQCEFLQTKTGTSP